jgi:hypothetical protein
MTGSDAQITRSQIAKSPRPGRALAAAAAYLAIALVLTWPLARGLARDVPSDLGDPLFVMWVLSWDAEQLTAIAGGDASRVPRFFDANIFHPVPRSLAYSEHLFAQALQAWPVYLASRNPILCYNLLFLSTFVLSGVGVFLLVRELTGSSGAAFVAGLLFAFAPYRWSQLSHLHVLSAQWMPLALYGARRYFETGSRAALAGGTAAAVLQALSSGYYLFFFAPVAVLYALWEVTVRGAWRNRRLWRDLAVATAVAAACTAPFLLPYKQLRDSLALARPPGEVARYSADVYSYFTAPDLSRAWGREIRLYPKPEGELFPGVTPLLLAAVGVAAWIAGASRITRDTPSRGPAWARTAVATLGCTYAVFAGWAIVARRIDLDLWLFSIRATDVTRLLVVPLVAAGVLLWLSPPLRARAAAAARRPEAIFLVLLGLACWLSLGPSPRVLGRPLDLWAPYGALMALPGFEGLRVPARFATIVSLALAVLAGAGAARLLRGRLASVALALLCVAVLADVRPRRIPMNEVGPPNAYAAPEPRVYRPARAPAVYHQLARTPPDAVVLELPIGDPGYDLRAVYYSTVHWRRLVNGYSGFYPPHYDYLIALLSTAWREAGPAWSALRELGVTHVVVHEGAYLDDEGARLSAWLASQGAREAFRDGTDVLLELKR